MPIQVPDGEVRVVESHHASNFAMELDAWPFHKIAWVAIGKGRLESDKRSHAIQKDDFLLLPAYRPHRFVDKPGMPMTLVILCLSEKYLRPGSDARRLGLWKASLGAEHFGEPRCARTTFHLSALVARFRLALREQGQRRTGWETALQMVADQMLLEFSRRHCEVRKAHDDSSLKTVQGVIEFIDANLCEVLRIEDMAERCRLSPRRFTDLFKQCTGQTFNHYVNRKRVEHACRRLAETGHILYACHESGFNDPAYFYRVFKKLTGKTPGEYLRGTACSLNA